MATYNKHRDNRPRGTHIGSTGGSTVSARGSRPSGTSSAGRGTAAATPSAGRGTSGGSAIGGLLRGIGNAAKNALSSARGTSSSGRGSSGGSLLGSLANTAKSIAGKYGSAAGRSTPSSASGYGQDGLGRLAQDAYFNRQQSQIDPTEAAGAYAGTGSMSLPDQSLLKRYQAEWNRGKQTGNQTLMDAAHKAAENLRDNYRYYPLKNSNGYGLGENRIGYIRDMVARTDALGNKYVDQYNRNSVTTMKYDKDGNFVNQHTSGDIGRHNARVAREMAETSRRLGLQGKEDNTFALRLDSPETAGLTTAQLQDAYRDMGAYGGNGRGLYDTPMAAVIPNGETLATQTYGYFDPNLDYAAAIAAETDPVRQAQLMRERQNKVNYLDATGQNPNGYHNGIYGLTGTGSAGLPAGNLTGGGSYSYSSTGGGDTIDLPEYSGMSYDEILAAYNSIAEQMAAQSRANLQQTQAQIDAAQGNANSKFDELARQAYINRRQSEAALPQQLSALGISGGGSETANLQLQTDYQNNLNDNELARQQMRKEYALKALQAQLAAEGDIRGYYADAQNNALGAWQGEQSNRNSWNQWAANFAQQQQQNQLAAQQWQANYDLSRQQYLSDMAQQKYQQQEALKQQQIELALKTGDYSKLAELGYNTDYLQRVQNAELEQLALEAQKLRKQLSSYTNEDKPPGPEKTELSLGNQMGNDWISVPGMGRVGTNEIEKLMENGEVEYKNIGGKMYYIKRR